MLKDVIEGLMDKMSEITTVKLDLATIGENIGTFSNEKICEMIICGRYFGMGEGIVALCMTELAKRRSAGDAFDFETFIADKSKELPVLDFKIPDVKSTLQNAMSTVRQTIQDKLKK